MLRITTRRGITETVEPEAALTALTNVQAPIINGTPGELTWSENTPSYLPIVPGAAGWGMSTTAGSGRDSISGGLAAVTTVYFVTNLNTSGPGSLRAALQAGGRRIIIPTLSGVIDYTGLPDSQRQFTINDGQMIYAGQCAPSPGLVVYGLMLVPNTVTGKDCLFWHLPIFEFPFLNTSIQTGDCVSHFHPPTEPPTTNSNIVFANCWFAWGNDEIVDANYGVHNITFWQCVFAEALANTNTFDGLAHPFGPVISRVRSESRGDFTRCVFAHNAARNPLTRAPLLAINNCLLFDTWERGISLEGWELVSTQTNIEGNIFLTGPTSPQPTRPIFRQTGGQGQLASTSTFFLQGNRALGWSDATQSGLVLSGPGSQVGSRITAAHPSGYTVTTIVNREEFARLVARHVGARPTDRMSQMTRTMGHVEARLTGVGDQGGPVLFPSSVGGMPALAVNTVDHTTGPDPIPGVSSQTSAATAVGTAGRTIMPSGYTALEEWLHRRHDAVMP